MTHSIVEDIPGVGGFFKRYYRSDDVVGVMFVEKAFVTLDDYEIKLPVDISMHSRRDVAIDVVDELDYPIQWLGKTVTIDITLVGRAGDWRKSVLPMAPDIPFAGEVIQGGYDLINTLLGTSQLVSKIKELEELAGKLKTADKPIKIEDANGRFSSRGIFHANIVDFRERTEDREIAWDMHLIADAIPDSPEGDVIQLFFATEE